jgi:hypothetical protein
MFARWVHVLVRPFDGSTIATGWGVLTAVAQGTLDFNKKIILPLGAQGRDEWRERMHEDGWAAGM